MRRSNSNRNPMTVETPFNITALRDAVLWVEKENTREPEERDWDQSTWVRIREYAVQDGDDGWACGTVACVAGHLVIEAGLTKTYRQNITRRSAVTGDYVTATATSQTIDIQAVADRFGIDPVGPWTCSCGCGELSTVGPDWPQVAQMILGLGGYEASSLFSGNLDATDIRQRAERIAENHGEVL